MSQNNNTTTFSPPVVPRGKLIAIEGIDGAGKTTIANAVAAELNSMGVKTLYTRGPGLGVPMGEAVRNILISDTSLSGEAEVMLILAARFEHQRQVIAPALTRGEWVVCDRYTDTTLAYQLAARLGLRGYLTGDRANHGSPTPLVSLLEELTWVVGDNLPPDLTLLLDLPVSVAMARVGVRGSADRIESESAQFFETIRQAYLTIEKTRGGGLLPSGLVDASKDTETAKASALGKVKDFYERQRPIRA
jgi:dTMP kinase